MDKVRWDERTAKQPSKASNRNNNNGRKIIIPQKIHFNKKCWNWKSHCCTQVQIIEAVKFEELKRMISISIDPKGPFQHISTLVGGNQQYVMMIKNSDTDPY